MGKANTLEYAVFDKPDMFTRGGSTWSLEVRINKKEWHPVATFTRKPTKLEILKFIKVGVNMCEVYHNSVLTPGFSLIY